MGRWVAMVPSAPIRDAGSGVWSTAALGSWTRRLMRSAAGWLQLGTGLPRKRFVSKFLRRPLTAVALPVMEESVFRGVVLEQLLEVIPATPVGRVAAVLIGGAGFSSVHFLRARHPGAAVWRPAWGLFLVGCVLGAIYVRFGGTLWMPVAVHAGAILVCEWSRLLFTYKAPPWLIGYAEFPQSGVVGGTGLIFVGIVVVGWL